MKSFSSTGCPCLHTTPCRPDCSCIEKFSSAGCRRCATYGSPEQQRAAAERLANLPLQLEGALATIRVHEFTIKQVSDERNRLLAEIARLGRSPPAKDTALIEKHMELVRDATGPVTHICGAREFLFLRCGRRANPWCVMHPLAERIPVPPHKAGE